MSILLLPLFAWMTKDGILSHHFNFMSATITSRNLSSRPTSLNAENSVRHALMQNAQAIWLHKQYKRGGWLATQDCHGPVHSTIQQQRAIARWRDLVCQIPAAIVGEDQIIVVSVIELGLQHLERGERHLNERINGESESRIKGGLYAIKEGKK